MLDLSPAKLLIIAIVAVILLGPDKLPQVARQAGAGWRKLRDFHQRVESEVRDNIPDLPSTQEIARLARSPVALLNHFANTSDADERLVEDPGAGAAAGASEAVTDPAAGSGAAAWPADPGAAAGAPLGTGTGAPHANGSSANGSTTNGAGDVEGLGVNGAAVNGNAANGDLAGTLEGPGAGMAGRGGTPTEVPFDPSLN
jgi:sec-independent protein translocase protein TatB